MAIIGKRIPKYYPSFPQFIRMRGQPDRYTNLVHAWNTFMLVYWEEVNSGGFWVSTFGLDYDIRESNFALLRVINNQKDEIDADVFIFIQGLKPAPEWKKYGKHKYETPMTYCHDKYGDLHPKHLLDEFTRIFKIESCRAMFKQMVKERGLIYSGADYGLN